MEVYEVQNPWSPQEVFRIRERMYLEGGFVGGGIYRFEVRNSRTSAWRLIFQDHWDDPDPIACDSIRFVDQQFAYVHTKLKFAVSRDAGASWQVHDVQELLSALRKGEKVVGTIETLTLDKSGAGILGVRLVTSGNPIVELVTADFGRTWKSKQGNPHPQD